MDRIKFKVNGVEYSVGNDISSDVMLLDYLRSRLQLRGTKYMCREGGCGACMVTASKSLGAPHAAVNSCLVSIGSCDGWDITTIEGLGNRKIGYHPIQKTLAEHNGSQCGYCTSGWVMSMHGLLETKKTVTMLEVEKSFGSNICRCTGYRPILEAFKRFATDTPKDRKIMDIEDLQICRKSGKQCKKSVCDDADDWCFVQNDDFHEVKVKRIELTDGKIWFKPRVLQDVFDILKTEGLSSYMLVGGNTAKGAVPISDYPRVLIDVSSLQELKTVTYDQNLIVGAGMTLTEFMDVLKTASETEFFGYLAKIYSHVDLVAHIPVRNLMPRAQSTHAIVNIGCLYQLDSTNVVQRARIVYGGLSSNFVRAIATETFLVGKSLFTNETLQAALKVLDGEMIVEANPPEPAVEYRRFVAKALFYKGLLTLCPPNIINTRYASGAGNLHESRPVSDAKQTFTSDPTIWPLNQPITKVESLIQCAGEAKYTDDIPTMSNEVFGAFVLSTVALGTIVKIDASAALSYPGVIAFYTAKDIPGLNSFTPADSIYFSANEEVLCSGTVKYYHQPLGIVVANSQHIAIRATSLVKVTYNNVKTPVIDIKVAKTDATRSTLVSSIDATSTGTDVYKTMSGSNTFYGQYPFTMETLLCVAKPTEEGIEVHSATQWLDATHVMISRALNMDENKIDCYVRRLGGGYGMKVSRSIQSAVACSLIVQKLNLPCRFIQPLTTNFRAVGKRLPSHNDYEVSVNKSGVIQSLNTIIYEDNGYKVSETLTALTADVYYNCYIATAMNFKSYDITTDTHKNTWCRSPITLETIAYMEYIMERISYELSLDPLAVRLSNLDTTNFNEITGMVDTLKTNAEYSTRRAAVDSFNTQNRWKKRGLRWAFARWLCSGGKRFDLNLSVYHGDGTVVLTHAGIEMGQGINTKAVQITAYLLKIPVEKIQVKGNNTIIAPNTLVSGGSLTTQGVIIALKRCCEELNARLDPIRATLTNPTWEDLITAAYNADVDLQVHGFTSLSDAQTYNVYGMALCEAEIDVLTGEHEILRVDMLQDVGLSISPEIDVGQVEGAFIMGLGYWTCEKLVFADTGEILTNRTWDYHVPEARDIPQDFRVYLKKNSYSNDVILSSKATGEPAMCSTVVVPFAIREATVQARQESGIPTTQWYDQDGPCSTENICMAAQTKTEDFKFY
ncbi:hypothetical protein B5X24_HaOG210767 [Helicoverpa armigera]|uniref:Uncharacterized protein n=1 Tax=Helicoverpa armigera TaxID=29058 RepID=A0A2W1BIK1_HELAM|nr:hypothetical protein B5X24_HaOG210767 [Helicoverpa armigera]